jgi:hypothetical protein
MSLAQYSSSISEYPGAGVPSTVGGTVVIAMTCLLGMPMVQAVEVQRYMPSSVIVANSATRDTLQSSTVKAGFLQEKTSTLISNAAKVAIGNAGFKRLENFFLLSAGWDGSASKPIDLSSVVVFSRFFSETGLRPNRLGIFMSAQGNVVVNWLDQDERLVELEFLPTGIEYFIERSGEEGTVPNGDIGFTKLFNRVAETVEA